MNEDFDTDDHEEPEPGLDELMEIAKAPWSESTERLRACVAAWHEEPETGRDLLLALSIDLDVDEEDRLSALQRLVRMDPPAVAAASWLMQQTDWGQLEGVYKGEAASIASGVIEEDLAAGLALIVANPHLDDLYRIWAGAHRVIEWTNDSFAELRTLFSDTAILVRLDEVAKLGGQDSRGVLIGHTALEWIVDDSTLPAAMRFRAADRRHIDDKRAGADAFEKLATDSTLDQDHRLRAAKELASIDPVRAAKVYPDLPENQAD
ncbi:hypothetical protein [Amycolatopsis silviterrae]|uniref:HEAT repeat domain-containing protein n=1 Tax=Amycolatopsis silviterrae TaxID=1656914 RepID=A0ABW5HHP5_9PSEU